MELRFVSAIFLNRVCNGEVIQQLHRLLHFIGELTHEAQGMVAQVCKSSAGMTQTVIARGSLASQFSLLGQF